MDVKTIYNKDCLVGIGELIRGGVQVDCVITDPPYMMKYKSNRSKNKDWLSKEVIVNDNNETVITNVIPLLYEVMKSNSALYMFCNSNKIDLFKTEIQKYFIIKNIIVWDKGNHTAGDLQAQFGKRYEFIIYANKGRRKFNDGLKRIDDIWSFPKVPITRCVHQNQKPIELIERMLLYSSNENDIVLDPFIGSCTTAIACRNLNRRCVGFEIDKEKYDIGMKRLKGEI